MKNEEDKDQWLNTFTHVYRDVKPNIDTITNFDILGDNLKADNLKANIKQVISAASSLSFVFQTINQVLPEPKDKQLRKLRRDFKDVLAFCVKNGAAWQKYVEAPGSKVKRHEIVFYRTMAKNISNDLSNRVTRITCE
jgi:hypothetical protein